MYRYLLERNIKRNAFYNAVEVNEKDYMGRTALFYAAEQGHFEICSELVQEDAKCHINDADNCNPVYYARKKQMGSLCLFL